MFVWVGLLFCLGVFDLGAREVFVCAPTKEVIFEKKYEKVSPSKTLKITLEVKIHESNLVSPFSKAE